jgi:hypothetical protein
LTVAYPLTWPDHIEQNPTRELVEQNFRQKAKTAHPDAGGSDAAMAELNSARSQALQEIGKATS